MKNVRGRRSTNRPSMKLFRVAVELDVGAFKHDGESRANDGNTGADNGFAGCTRDEPVTFLTAKPHFVVFVAVRTVSKFGRIE